MVQRLCMVIHGHSRPFMVFHCHSILGACKSSREERDKFLSSASQQFFPVSDISQTHLFDRIQENHSHWYKTNQRLRTAFPVSLWKSAMLVDGVG